MQRKINANFNFLFQLKVLINILKIFHFLKRKWPLEKIFIHFNGYVQPHLHLMELKNWPERFLWFQIFLNLVMLGQCLLSRKHWKQITLRFRMECFWKLTNSLSPGNMLLSGNIRPNPQRKLCVTGCRSITNIITYFVYLIKSGVINYTFQLIWS